MQAQSNSGFVKTIRTKLSRDSEKGMYMQPVKQAYTPTKPKSSGKEWVRDSKRSKG